MEDYVWQNIVVATLVLGVVGAVLRVRHSDLWRQAGRQVLRQLRASFGIAAVYGHEDKPGDRAIPQFVHQNLLGG